MAKNRHSSCWVRSLHGLGLTYDVTVLEDGFKTERELYAAEQWWIAYGKALGWDLTNLTKGGEGQIGWVPSVETRQKIADAHRGRKLPAETRQKMSEAHKGRTMTAESRLKLSASKTGHRHTDETRTKMSAAAKVRPPRLQGTEERARRRVPPRIRINLLSQD